MAVADRNAPGGIGCCSVGELRDLAFTDPDTGRALHDGQPPQPAWECRPAGMFSTASAG
ncbi:hypothetical protein [Frankia sp. Cas4]|uniref:hypothetical protein n=1 Tax=Frankia sp. Cas4 TaxID=3073927 RepID=UPI002AD47437|nr:hypothetical protein [Frankia sp. Cas4]